MWKGFFKSLGTSRWQPWISAAPFALLPILVMYEGQMVRAIGVLIFIASVWAGVVLGGRTGDLLATHMLRASEPTRSRLIFAFAAFGFLFLPAVTAAFTNAQLGTTIEMLSLGKHVLLACFGAGVVFLLSPPASGS